GTEIFHDQSSFEFTDWDETNDEPLFAGADISGTTVGAYTALFGHLKVAPAVLTSNWTAMLPASVDVNLTHGNLELVNDNGDNINLYTGNTSILTIGGDMIVSGTGNV